MVNTPIGPCPYCGGLSLKFDSFEEIYEGNDCESPIDFLEWYYCRNCDKHCNHKQIKANAKFRLEEIELKKFIIKK